MKRVIKANKSELDKFTHVEGSQYDPGRQEHTLQEIADKLDPYGIDVEVDKVTDDGIEFMVSQPQYPEVGERYCVLKGQSGPIYESKKRGGYYNEYIKDVNRLLYLELAKRFNLYFGESASYLEVLQARIDETAASIERKHNVQLNLIVSDVDMSYYYPLDLGIRFDSSSFILVDGVRIDTIEDLYIEDYAGLIAFALDMSPSSFREFLSTFDILRILEDRVLQKLSHNFVDSDTVSSEIISLLNDKLAKSKYTVYVNSVRHSFAECSLEYLDEIYTFDIIFSSADAFSVWFKDSHREYDQAIDFIVKNLYKKITSKCRKIIAKIRQREARSAQQARDSAQL